MTNANNKHREVIELDELNDTLSNAKKIESEYDRLRTLALIIIFYLTGKRVSEVAILKVSDLKISKSKIVILFTLSKKRKKTKQPDGTYKSIRKYETSRKALDRSNTLTQYVVDYYRYLSKHHKDCVYLFPSTINFFGTSKIFRKDNHLSRSQIWRIIKKVNPNIWCHLFRETVGAKIAEANGMTLESVYKIKLRLDLVKEDTAFRYVRRYAEDTIKE